jgi:four helix bundle protein
MKSYWESLKAKDQFEIADFRLTITLKPLSGMNKEEFKQRTKLFAINTAKFCKTLSYDFVVKSYINQIVRSSSSVGANYRSACRAKSKADFIKKMKIVEEEADESLFFFELLAEFYTDRKEELRVLYKEGDEILAMTVKSINTARTSLKESSI